MSEADERRVYETLELELGPKVMDSFDSLLRLRVRADSAEAITDIRQRYGTPRVGEESTPNVRYPDDPDGGFRYHSPSKRLPLVSPPRRR